MPTKIYHHDSYDRNTGIVDGYQKVHPRSRIRSGFDLGMLSPRVVNEPTQSKQY